jgi:high-affinity iron transporter
MLPILVVSLREGIEAFLIVAITAVYLKKTGRHDLLSAVYWGTGAAIAASAIAAYFFSQASNKPLWEGLLALIAATLVISMTVFMWKKARTIGKDIRAQVDAATAKQGWGAYLGIFAFVVLMIAREGMETALVISTLMLQTGSGDLLAGALLGISLAALLAWAWTRYGHRVDMGRFFKVTAVFLMLFSVQLVIYAFHEFTEVGMLPIDNEYWHVASEPFGPEGRYGQMLSFGLVLIPALWLAASAFFSRALGAGSATKV